MSQFYDMEESLRVSNADKVALQAKLSDLSGDVLRLKAALEELQQSRNGNTADSASRTAGACDHNHTFGGGGITYVHVLMPTPTPVPSCTTAEVLSGHDTGPRSNTNSSRIPVLRAAVGAAGEQGDSASPGTSPSGGSGTQRPVAQKPPTPTRTSGISRVR